MNQLWEGLHKCKGGCIVEHIDTGSLMFLPGSNFRQTFERYISFNE